MVPQSIIIQPMQVIGKQQTSRKDWPCFWAYFVLNRRSQGYIGTQQRWDFSMNRICTFVSLLLLFAVSASADVVTLKNGTKVEGTVIKFGSDYRVKQSDGS